MIVNPYIHASGGLAPLWTPAEISVAAWFDEGSTVRAVSQWLDKSGNGHHFTPGSAVAQPAYVPAAVNGRNVIRCDGVDDYLTAAGALINETHSLFICFRPTIEAAPGVVVSQYNSAAAGRLAFTVNANCVGATAAGSLSTFIQGTTGGACALAGGAGLPTHGTVAPGATLLGSLMAPGEGWQTYLNGALVDSMTAPSIIYKGTPTELGRLPGFSQPFDGDYLEVLLIDGSKVDQSTREIIEGYFADRWGFALPVGHPYENDPPDWNPSEISPDLWLDASDAATVTLSGVAQWLDKSGNGYHLSQETPANRPTFVANELNGRGVLRFDGAGDRLSRTSGLTGLAQNVPGVTMFAVRRFPVSPATIGRVVSIISPGPTTRALLCGGLTPNRNEVAGSRLDDGTHNSVVAPNNMSTAWQIHEGVLDFANGGAFLYVDGSLEAQNTSFSDPGNTPSTSPTELTVGVFAGDVAAVLLLNFAADTTTRQLIQGYFAHWYGLSSSLPMDHPYRDEPPTVP